MALGAGVGALAGGQAAFAQAGAAGGQSLSPHAASGVGGLNGFSRAARAENWWRRSTKLQLSRHR